MYIYKKKLQIITFCFVITLSAQSNYTKDEYNKVWASFLESKDIKEKNAIADEYMSMSKKDKDMFRIGTANYLYYLIYVDTNPEKALFYLNKTIAITKVHEYKNYPFIAYRSKAYLLTRISKFDEAVNCLKEAEQFEIKKENYDHLYAIKHQLGVLKADDLGEKEEAIKIFKECFNYYKNSNPEADNYNFYMVNVLYSLAENYRLTKAIDSSKYYGDAGYKFSKKIKDDFYTNIFILNEVYVLINQKKFNSALNKLNSISHFFKTDEVGVDSLEHIYYCYGISYLGLKNESKAIENFQKVDSLYKTNKQIDLNLVDTYTYLINNAKKNKDAQKQIEYMTTSMEIEKMFRNKYKQLYKLITKKYDLPIALHEKETSINKLTIYILIISIVLAIVASLGLYFYIKNRKYKSQFKKIIELSSQWKNRPHLLSLVAPYEYIDIEYIEESNEVLKIIPEEKETIFDIKNEEIQEEKISYKEIGLKSEIIEDLLKKFEKFEKKNQFLNANITIIDLAKEFKTNQNYLSKVVNVYKGESFNHYLNNLRIEYAIVALQNNKKLLEYSLDSLAKDFGFQSLNTFTSAFVKKTGVKPSFFVNQLKK